MKRMIVVVLFHSILIGYCLSQTIDKLDERAGFKTIKLNDSISIYKGRIEYFKSDETITSYSFIGEDQDLWKLFDIPLSTITLYFNNKTKKIFLIQLISVYSKDQYASEHYRKAIADFKIVVSSFNSLFGKNTSVDSEETTEKSTISNTWEGKKVLLMVDVSYYGLNKFSEISTTIADLKMLNSKIGDGF